MEKLNWQAIQANMEKNDKIENDTDIHNSQRYGKHQTAVPEREYIYIYIYSHFQNGVIFWVCFAIKTTFINMIKNTTYKFQCNNQKVDKTIF